jgi:hypothetical protein
MCQLRAGAYPVPKPACFSQYKMMDGVQKSLTKCKLLLKEPEDRVANIFWLQASREAYNL